MIKHIILVSLDTLRGDCVGPAKFRNFKTKPKFELKTEIIDNLIDKGTFFNNCISSAPYTTASHASIFTGFFPLKHHVYEYFNRKICKETIFEAAKKQDFITIMQTDFPIMLGEYLGLNNGVEHFFVEDENKALELLLNNQDKKTLSLFHFGGIHYPYGFHTIKFGGKDYTKKVEELEKEYSINPEIELEDALDETFRNEEDKKLLFRYKRIIEFLYHNKKYEKLTELYLEGINYFLKNRFKYFLETISPLLEREDTLLILFGDHGEHWDAETYGHYNSNEKGVLNVPLLFYGKNIPKKIINDPVRNVDIGATIMKLIGSEIKDLDGIDLKPFSNEMPPKDLFSISQTWIDTDKNELLEHQQNIVKNKKITKKLKPYKKSESVFYKNYRLIRTFNEKKEKIKESELENKEIYIKLQNYLDDYNKYIPKDNEEVNKAEELKKELRLMGYEI